MLLMEVPCLPPEVQIPQPSAEEKLTVNKSRKGYIILSILLLILLAVVIGTSIYLSPQKESQEAPTEADPTANGNFSNLLTVTPSGSTVVEPKPIDSTATRPPLNVNDFYKQVGNNFMKVK